MSSRDVLGDFRFIPLELIDVIGEMLGYQSKCFLNFSNTVTHFQPIKYKRHHMKYTDIGTRTIYNQAMTGGMNLENPFRFSMFSVKVHAWKGWIDQTVFRKAHGIKLEYCDSIPDVSVLGRVHTLTIWRCDGITDVSGLGGVHTLTIRRCYGIRDVSGLGGVHTLTIWGCDGITDVSSLGGVHTLTIERCYGITDVSALASVPNLRIYDCQRLKSVVRGTFLGF